MKAKHLIFALLIALATSAQAKEINILVAHPVTFGLATHLLQDTTVNVQRAAPGNLPPSRQPSYFAGRGAVALKKLAQQADAVVALRSLWPDDPLYPMARRSNIRIVEIDAARPVDAALPGIAKLPDDVQDQALSSYPWLSINNMGRMADVIAADLLRLFPELQKQIASNHSSLKQQLLKLNAHSQQQLAKVANLSVYSLSNRLDYLISGLNLDLLGHETRPEAEWDAAFAAQLVQTLREEDAALVLHHKQPPQAVRDALQAAAIELLVVQLDGDDPLAELEGNVGQLLKLLSPES